MSGLDWLDGGPEEWTRQYIAAQTPGMAGVVTLGMKLMPLLGQRICPLCSGPHNLSKCPGWINPKGVP